MESSKAEIIFLKDKLQGPIIIIVMCLCFIHTEKHNQFTETSRYGLKNVQKLIYNNKE